MLYKYIKVLERTKTSESDGGRLETPAKVVLTDGLAFEASSATFPKINPTLTRLFNEFFSKRFEKFDYVY